MLPSPGSEAARIKVALHAVYLFDVHKDTGLQAMFGHLAIK